jgi:hypothetical protein
MEDFDSFLSGLIAKHDAINEKDKAAIEHLRPIYSRLHAWTNRDKENPLNPRELLYFLKDIRALTEASRKAHGGEKDAEYESSLEKFNKLEELLDPQKRLILLVRGIRDHATAGLDTKAVDTAIKAYHDSPDDTKRQIRYMLRMIGTQDAFGVVVRGHVLIENMLDTCIYEYAQNPMDLFNEIGLFGAQKIKLACMLGVIDTHEQQILLALNTLRNKVAHGRHRFPDVGDPDFELAWSDEKSLWSKFTNNEAMSGEWPAYSKDNFPEYLRYIYLHVYSILSSRSAALAKHKLKPILDAIKPDEGQRLIQPVLTIFYFKLFEHIGNVAFDE